MDDESSMGSVGSTDHVRSHICIAVWATRTLTILSIVLCMVAFGVVGETWFGIFLLVTAAVSVMSPLNCYCCCWSGAARNSRIGRIIRHCGVYMWMFVSNMAYLVMFGYCWYFWKVARVSYSGAFRFFNKYYTGEQGTVLLDTIFAFSLIITVFLSILNFYSFYLVAKYGFCFMNEVDRNPALRRSEIMVNIDEVSSISSTGANPLDGNWHPTTPETASLQTIHSGWALNPPYEIYLTEPVRLSTAPVQPASGVTANPVSQTTSAPIQPASGVTADPVSQTTFAPIQPARGVTAHPVSQTTFVPIKLASGVTAHPVSQTTFAPIQPAGGVTAHPASLTTSAPIQPASGVTADPARLTTFAPLQPASGVTVNPVRVNLQLSSLPTITETSV